MPAIDLVATDLDGTLWDETERVHPAARAAMSRLAGAGVRVLAATGRRRRTAARLFDAHGLSLPGVFLDGAVVVEADRTGVARAAFTPESGARVLDAFGGEGVVPLVVVERPGVDLVRPPEYAGSVLHLERNRPWVEDGDAARAVERGGVLAFIVIGGDRERLRAVEAALAGVAAASLTHDRVFGGTTLQARPLGISKWSGVLAYCDHRAIDPARVLAVGDAANDVELLRGAALACAMGDSVPELLALADHVLPTASEGGWAAIADIVLG